MNRYYYVTKPFYILTPFEAIVRVVSEYNEHQFRGKIIKVINNSMGFDGSQVSFSKLENVELNSNICELLYE